VVTISSSDIEEALGLLSLSPCRNLSSQLSGGNAREPSSSSSSDLFEDWFEASDMVVSIYVALTVEASASFLPKRFHLHFRNFDLAPGLLGASFLLKLFHLCFCDFCDIPPLSKDG
jgi:hypothetical protein